ncbi:dol-P-Glc:Glc(2)Man(9)GlcNAc(2)-PP-Dol alpha-1,2-glucosyltransferase isoform X1 [Ananas comosus]|uniref:Dol-P-Glc:Glc(2)Man(9)GlcNAc(2)-PP-Dol alpha-1,2-glucosyltransferase n=4 Tax=Ananas comosus TaxID=4615 RepID=A0A6P5G7D6_ANACO|nr:dol-P-Glc:Glc(2)Man(9)GlcNAc(2)-PP-Dol alpha-1,2-glucosyltransferase isoform X1 [Ananas comosus]
MGRIAVAAAAGAWAIPIAILVDRLVPDPYMDEIFHVPQAQRYCGGDLRSWDPMITTPPGLYYVSLAYVASLFPGMWLINGVQSLSQLCSTTILRSTNVALTIICSILVHDLLVHLRPSIGERRASFYAILISLYPVHWFFTFLYYTDIASLTAVLAMYLASLKKRFWVSAILGALAILFRQTNVVWVIFVAANGAIKYAEDFYETKSFPGENEQLIQEENNLLTNKKRTSTFPSLRRRKMNNSANTNKLRSSESSGYSHFHSPGIIIEILDITLKLWSLKWKVLIAFAPYAMILIAFAAFIIWNRGIVLGAKEAHVVSPHFAQLLYFGLVSAAALAPFHFTPHQVAKLCQLFKRNKVLGSFLVFAALGTSCIIVHFFSIAHPYLLADNRHYPFYIWRKVIQAHSTMKYILVPLYVYSWFSIITILGESQKRAWVLSFVLCVALVLIPAPLIEFRYFTIPFFLLILHSPATENSKWLVLGLLYAAVDIFTMAMFLFRPFRWEHEAGVQRFMW